MDGWYVGINGQQRGPLTLDEVTAAARSAGPNQTYVWREGFAEWKFAADVPEIAARLGAAPPRPMPPGAAGQGRAAPQGGAAYPAGADATGGGRGVSFVEAIQLGFKNYVTFRGRAPRSEFWFWVLFGLLVGFVTAIADLMLGMSDYSPLNTIAALALFLPGLAVSARRLHDIDRTAWWLLIALVPLVGFILLLVWFCTGGTSGPNRFGEDPLGG